MLCAHCGHAMLEGFKFCHHCGKPAETETFTEPEVNALTEESVLPPTEETASPPPEQAPPLAEQPPQPTEESPPRPEQPLEEPSRPEEPTKPPEQPRWDAPPPQPAQTNGMSTGKLFFLELICYLPVLNFLVLAFLAAGRKPWRSKLAQAKLLAMMTVTLIVLTAVLTLIVLMYYDVIPPIYLGHWRT